MFLENKYHKWYFVIISQGDDYDDYVEKHHILPKSLGGLNKKTNLIRVKARKHFILHWLLTKFTEGQEYYKMLHAFSMMSTMKRGRCLSSWQYERARIANSVAGRFVTKKRYEDPLEHEKTSLANFKRYEDIAEIEKLSVAQTERWSDPDARKSQSLALSKHLVKPEAREQRRAATSKRYEDPLEHDKAREAQRKRYEDPKAHDIISAAQIKRWARQRGEIPEDRTLEQIQRMKQKSVTRRARRSLERQVLDG
jgi:hypothetical protein